VGSYSPFSREPTASTETLNPSPVTHNPEPPTMLVHNVYFSLLDDSPAARQKMLDACRKYLTDHPGTVLFACGTLTPDLTRPVNDREWDVGLHVVFADRAAHDAYQTHPRHVRFIEENRASWKKVRVFDSDV